MKPNILMPIVPEATNLKAVPTVVIGTSVGGRAARQCNWLCCWAYSQSVKKFSFEEVKHNS